jgi:probable rRNA maturation factor
MTQRIVIQLATENEYFPKTLLLRKWARSALQDDKTKGDVTIRIVDENEMTALNETYRHKQGPTNVLSFPFLAPEEIDLPLLGDIVVCGSVVNAEALAQAKTKDAHWAHMIIHGVLHLQGYDHVAEDDAEVMEALEIKLLHDLGFDNPYEGDKVKYHE